MKNSRYKIEIIQKQANYYPDPTRIFNYLCGSRSETLLLLKQQKLIKKMI